MRRLAILGSFLAAFAYWRRRRSGPFLPRASVKDIMIMDPVTIEPAATLAQAAQAMRDGDVGILPVVDGGELRGIVTDRDLVVRSMAVGADPSTVRVGDVATAPVVGRAGKDMDTVETARRVARRSARAA